MIQIIRLVGESYDFTTGRELGKGVVLSNGISECTVEASEELIQAVLGLFAETVENAGERRQPEPKKPVIVHKETVPKNGGHRVQPPPPPQEEVEEEREPGEEYEDAETGTQSI